MGRQEASKEVASPWYRRWIYEGIRSALPLSPRMITGAVVAGPDPDSGSWPVIGGAVGQALPAIPFGFRV